MCYGFIGNRMMDPYAREAEHCLLEGATPEQVDGALEQFGMAMGILAVFDMAGVDIDYLTRLARKHLMPEIRRSPADTMLNVAAGSDDPVRLLLLRQRTKHARSEVVAMLWEEGKRLRSTPAAQHEGSGALPVRDDQRRRTRARRSIALRAGDIDVVYTSGYGFPRYRGGPMFCADRWAEGVYARILEFRNV